MKEPRRFNGAGQWVRRRAGARPGLTPEPMTGMPRTGTGSPITGAFKVGSTFNAPGSRSGIVGPLTMEQSRTILASQGIYPSALYPTPAWAAGLPAGWTSQLLSPTLPASESSLPFSFGGGYGGGTGNGGGGFSLSSIPSWVWIGAAIFGGIVLLKGKGGKSTGAGGGSMIPKNFRFKAKVK